MNVSIVYEFSFLVCNGCICCHRSPTFCLHAKSEQLTNHEHSNSLFSHMRIHLCFFVHSIAGDGSLESGFHKPNPSTAHIYWRRITATTEGISFFNREHVLKHSEAQFYLSEH